MSKINSAIDTGLAVAQAPQNPTGALMQVPKVAIYAAEKALGDKADPEKVNDAYALASDVGGGAVKGAAVGALAGSWAGPPGAAIGAAIGTPIGVAYGVASNMMEFNKKKSAKK